MDTKRERKVTVALNVVAHATAQAAITADLHGPGGEAGAERFEDIGGPQGNVYIGESASYWMDRPTALIKYAGELRTEAGRLDGVAAQLRVAARMLEAAVKGE